MKSTLWLFKALPVVNKNTLVNEELCKDTVKLGFIFSPVVIANYSTGELRDLIKEVKKLVLTGNQMNAAFHKSWEKIRTASIEQLVLEQIVHYMTTYGFEKLGVYSEESVYIPNERIDVPELQKGFRLIVIKGYTKDELRDKLLVLLNGIALAEDTMKHVVDLATYLEFNDSDIQLIRNKEVKIQLYDYLSIVPENPIEFLRYAVYKSMGKTLLIKSKNVINAIQEQDNINILGLFHRYKVIYGLDELAAIFYRFKPLFLAFRNNTGMRKMVNKIRRLAVMHHKPMQEDYLNSVTGKIKNNVTIVEQSIINELAKVNVFRKIRLAYALKFRTGEVDSILYKIRNGKSYATDFEFKNKKNADDVLSIVIDSIVNDVSKNVNGKIIYIPSCVKYALPSTEKQFVGYIPSGTCVTITNDMIVGVHWENQKSRRIDLDLSMLNAGTKIGWDGCYRSQGSNILFSGDLTSAPLPHGASELFYIKKKSDNQYIFMLNYFNYCDNEDIVVPFQIIIAQENINSFRKNYVINPNHIKTIIHSKIDQNQKILGLLDVSDEKCDFYFSESYIGKSITSYNSKYIEQSRKYLFDYYRNTVSLNEILLKAGAIITDNVDECEVDLTPDSLEKDTILNLLQ